MNEVKLIFFGSSSDSVIVLTRLAELTLLDYDLRIVAVVTQPPKPVGRNRAITPTPVAAWATAHSCPILTFEGNAEKPWLYTNETDVSNALSSMKADLLVSASYGQKIPADSIQGASHGGLNIHPSILPRWRGGDPVPWAILSGDHQIGVTVTTLADRFDQGRIIAQKKIPIEPHDLPDPLRTKLFTMGAELLTHVLPDYLSGKNKGKPQSTGTYPYAKRLTRETGFEPWKTIEGAFSDSKEAERLERKVRALTPWPGVWTEIDVKNGSENTMKKRLKILSCSLASGSGFLVPVSVQLEGKNPAPFSQFRSAYLQ